MTQPAPRLAADLTVLQRRRLSWRVAEGVPLGKAAKLAGLGAPATAELLQDTSFAALVEAYRSMAAMSEGDRLGRLVELAWLVLEEAVIRSDARAALFILKQRTYGRDPALVLAKGVVRALERQPPAETTAEAAAPCCPQPMPPATPTPREPACPVDNAINKAASALREGILDEVEKEAGMTAARPVRRPGGAPHEKPATPVRRSETPAVTIDRLSPGRLALPANLTGRAASPTAPQPQTEPRNPNAP